MAQIAARVPAHHCRNALVTRARGTTTGRDEKVDALVVVAWTDGMIEPAVFTRGFSPAAKEGFSLLIQDQPLSELDRITASFSEDVTGLPQRTFLVGMARWKILK